MSIMSSVLSGFSTNYVPCLGGDTPWKHYVEIMRKQAQARLKEIAGQKKADVEARFRKALRVRRAR